MCELPSVIGEDGVVRGVVLSAVGPQGGAAEAESHRKKQAIDRLNQAIKGMQGLRCPVGRLIVFLSRAQDCPHISRGVPIPVP